MEKEWKYNYNENNSDSTYPVMAREVDPDLKCEEQVETIIRPGLNSFPIFHPIFNQ